MAAAAGAGLIMQGMTERERERERETARQRDSETERQRDRERETERQRDRETERQRDKRDEETERQRDRRDTCVYIYIWSPPPHDRPSPLKHRPHRRIRAFPEVSSFSPDFVCPEPHPGQNQKNKNPKSHGECGDSFGFLDFWIFVFLDFRIFGFYIAKPKKQKKQNTKNPKLSHILRETLDFWFFGFRCILVAVTASASIQIIIRLLKLN